MIVAAVGPLLVERLRWQRPGHVLGDEVLAAE
jgi:hypothetical protein